MARAKIADPTVRELAQQIWSLEDQLDGAQEGSDVAELERLLSEHRQKLAAALTKQDERIAKHHPKVQALLDATDAQNAKTASERP